MEERSQKKQKTEEMHNFFLELWDEREEMDAMGRRYVVCFETGKKLYREVYRMNSCCYHHLILKSKRPDLALMEENIVIIHPSVHAQVHSDIDKTPKVKELTNLIKEKFEN